LRSKTSLLFSDKSLASSESNVAAVKESTLPETKTMIACALRSLDIEKSSMVFSFVSPVK
jgi:hypothetical protein